MSLADSFVGLSCAFLEVGYKGFLESHDYCSSVILNHCMMLYLRIETDVKSKLFNLSVQGHPRDLKKYPHKQRFLSNNIQFYANLQV